MPIRKIEITATLEEREIASHLVKSSKRPFPKGNNSRGSTPKLPSQRSLGINDSLCNLRTDLRHHGGTATKEIVPKRIGEKGKTLNAVRLVINPPPRR